MTDIALRSAETKRTLVWFKLILLHFGPIELHVRLSNGLGQPLFYLRRQQHAEAQLTAIRSEAKELTAKHSVVRKSHFDEGYYAMIGLTMTCKVSAQLVFKTGRMSARTLLSLIF